jgi:hypothetical protein
LTEQRVVKVSGQRTNGSTGSQDCDLFAVEEHLEIRLKYGILRGAGLHYAVILLHDIIQMLALPNSDSGLVGPVGMCR